MTSRHLRGKEKKIKVAKEKYPGWAFAWSAGSGGEHSAKEFKDHKKVEAAQCHKRDGRNHGLASSLGAKGD